MLDEMHVQENPAEREPATIEPSARYFNRELSWLAFNQRVLEESINPAHSLLERLRFLSISGSNLDEFFMVRVAGLKGQQLQNIEERSVDGLTPTQQLEAITRDADALMGAQQAQWARLSAELAEAGITVLDEDAIQGADITVLEQHFREQIFPVHASGARSCTPVPVHSKPGPELPARSQAHFRR